MGKSSRPKYLSFTHWVVLVYVTLGVGLSFWVVATLEKIQITDYWTMLVSLAGIVALAGATLQVAIGDRRIWKVVFVILCLEFVNWNFVVPALGIPRLGSLEASISLVLMDAAFGAPLLILVYMYAFGVGESWNPFPESDHPAATND